MKHSELVELAEKDPVAIETTTKALERVLEFRKGRGAMLASLRDPDAAQVARIFHKLSKDPIKCQ